MSDTDATLWAWKGKTRILPIEWETISLCLLFALQVFADICWRRAALVCTNNKLFAVENQSKIAFKLRLDGFICFIMFWLSWVQSPIWVYIYLDIGCIISDIYRIFSSLIGRRKWRTSYSFLWNLLVYLKLINTGLSLISVFILVVVPISNRYLAEALSFEFLEKKRVDQSALVSLYLLFLLMGI